MRASPCPGNGQLVVGSGGGRCLGNLCLGNHSRVGESNNGKAYVLAIILEWESQAMLRPRVVAAIVITSIATSYDYSYNLYE